MKSQQFEFSIPTKFFKIEFHAVDSKLEDQSQVKLNTDGASTDSEKEFMKGSIEVLRVKDEKDAICIDFTRNSGSTRIFYDHFYFICKDLSELNEGYREASQREQEKGITI